MNSDPKSLIAALRKTTYNAPWNVGREPRRDNAVAIKSSCYTVLTVGDYYDGGSDEQEIALAAICEAVNEGLGRHTGLGVECICERCSRDYPVWSADSEAWNLAVNRTPEHGDEWQFLCPTCFVRLHEIATGTVQIWELRAE